MASQDPQRKSQEDVLCPSALKHTLDAMFVIDSFGKILAASDSVEKVFGWTPEELVGQNIVVVMAEPYQSHHDEYLANYRRAGKTLLIGQPREFEALRKDGTKFPCEVSASLINFPDRPEPLIGGIIRDLTNHKKAEQERRALEAKIQQTQKLESLGVLAGGIAHDFNNLLMGVLGNAQLALKELSQVSPARQTVERIETTAMRAAELTKQMLAYSGRGKFVIKRIDVSELVEEIGHLLDVSIAMNVVIKYNLSPNLPPIEADVTQIRQVVMNLITNASDAIGEKSGVITITTGAMDADRAYLSETYLDERLSEGTYVYLEVSDTGCGMDQTTKQRVFDPFFTTKTMGRGLGMAAVLGIVRGHRGAIKCYSESGRGTTFKVLFPASSESWENQDEQLAVAKSETGDGETILVVDDQETIRTLARRMLEMYGYNVLIAEDGREGVEVFKQHADDIALVLLDMTMPHMGGEEAYRELRRVKKDIRVILSSGYNEEETVERFAGKGLAGFIQKPYGPSDLIPLVQRVLKL